MSQWKIFWNLYAFHMGETAYYARNMEQAGEYLVIKNFERVSPETAHNAGNIQYFFGSVAEKFG